MRKIICILCVLLISTVAFAQVQDRPIDLLAGPETEVMKMDRLEEVAVSGFEAKTDLIVASAANFPEDQRADVIIALADLAGLYTYVLNDGRGCVAISDKPGLQEHYESVSLKRFDYCNIYFCSSRPYAAPSCTVNCVGRRLTLVCYRGNMACCGCIEGSFGDACGHCYPVT
jgi:hypothetical protein